MKARTTEGLTRSKKLSKNATILPPRIRLYTSEYFEVGRIFAGILCTHTPG